jgi:hypothetical protein
MGLPRLPRPDEGVIHVHSAASGQIGPMSRIELKQKMEGGELPANANVWMDGMAGWEPLDAHKQALFEGRPGAAAAAAPTTDFSEAQNVPVESKPAPGESKDDALDRVFGDLVKESWRYLGEHRFASHIDEVFLGAIITSTLDTGYSLIDLSSDGSHHYLRFENLSDKSRIIVRLTHLTASLALAKVLGQRASAIIGYGEKVGNLAKIWSAIQAEMKSAYIQDSEPGTITVDGDINSGYVYCQVDLYLDIDQYVSRDYAIDYPKLASHIGATTHALRKYLRGRFA